METAMEAVTVGVTSINKAAVMYGVPCTTLMDRMSGRVVHGWTYLDKDEEKALADHLIEVASIGYGKTRREVKSITAKEKNLLRKERVTDGWWRRFKERQPMGRGDATAHVRMNATNKASYYKKLFKNMACQITLHRFTTWMRVVCH